ncbi:MAG: hypothetical protein R2749_01995 [Acidimicrobiales bacterium]
MGRLRLPRWSTGNLTTPSPAWREITTGTKAEKMEKMADPVLRRAVLEEAEEADRRLQAIQAGVGGSPEKLIVQGVNQPADLQQYVGRSLGDIATAEGKHPIEVMLDLSLMGDLNVEFLGPDSGSNADFDGRDDQRLAHTIPGVSDGGAHTKFFNGGSWSTDYLRWLVRDEGKVTLEEAHYRRSALAAHAAGFKDRRCDQDGAAADVVVYDMESLTSSRRGSVRWCTTCPVASGAASSGPRATTTSSSTAWRRSRTGTAPAVPGKLLRHGQM